MRVFTTYSISNQTGTVLISLGKHLILY